MCVLPVKGAAVSEEMLNSRRKYLEEKLSQETVHSMFREALDIEKRFITESLPVSLIGMNSELMGQYLEFTADLLIKDLGYQPLFGTKNPFEWMELISLEGKTNFFEKRVSEYQRSNFKPKVVGSACTPCVRPIVGVYLNSTALRLSTSANFCKPSKSKSEALEI